MSKNPSVDAPEHPPPSLLETNPYKRPRMVLRDEASDILASPRAANRHGTADRGSMQQSPSNGHTFLPNARDRPVNPNAYDLPMRHRDIQELRASDHPTIVQRRGYPSSGRPPALHLSEPDREACPIPVETVPSIQSAPPQQRRFSSETRLPLPHMLASSDQARLDPYPRPSLGSPLPPAGPEMQGYLPTPGGTPRVSMSQSVPLLSPAYSTHAPLGYHRRPSDGARPMDPNQGGEAPQGSAPNKAHFLSLFSSFYDSLSDSRALKTTLEHQINASNALLQTLQRSSQVLEDAVEQRVRQYTQVWESRLSRMEERLARIEARLAEPAEHRLLDNKI